MYKKLCIYLFAISFFCKKLSNKAPKCKVFIPNKVDKKHERRFFVQFSDVCWLRLDFESFTLLGPTVTTESQGGLCTDTFKITVI